MINRFHRRLHLTISSTTLATDNLRSKSSLIYHSLLSRKSNKQFIMGNSCGAASGISTSTATTTSSATNTTNGSGPWAPRPEERASNKLPTIACIGGTGRMGVHLCAAWANAGYDVTMCSRTKSKAQSIVDSLLKGKGYEKEVTGANAGQGNYAVPPSDASNWKLKAGDNVDAARADVIVLSTMYEQAWPILSTIKPKIVGKNKIILDMTNPFLTRPDGYGAGLPKDGPQAGILIHKEKLNDPSTKWVGAYKHILWTLILPHGPKNPSRPDIEVFGDQEGVDVVCEMIYRHGWRPIVRGGLEVAPDYEGGVVSFSKIMSNLGKEIKYGEKLSVGW